MNEHNTSDGTEFTNRRAFLKGVGAAAIVSGTAGCLDGGDGDGNGAYTIGMVDSITGSLAPYGERNKRGLDLALEDVNAAGIGSDNQELDIIREDDETDNNGGINAAQKLVNQDGVPLFIGSVGSGVSLAMHNSVVRGSDVVQISQNSTSPLLTDEPDLLRMSPSGASKGNALADIVYENGDERAAVTWINNDYGDGLSSVFEESFEGEVVYNSPHDPAGSSYSSTLTEMADTDADAWLFITYADEFTIMVNEAYDLGYNEDVTYYGAESTIAPEILEDTEPGSQNGLVGVTESAQEDQESYQEFKQRFEDEYGQAPTVWAGYTYDAIVVSALAIQAADEFSGPALADVVRDVTRPDGQEVFTFEEGKEVLENGGSPSDIDYQGVSGPIDLNENGDPKGFYQIYRVENHEYVFGDYITG